MVIANDLYFFEGGGEMGDLIRSTNWKETSLGDPDKWPQSLRTAISIMLNNPFGMYIAWGKDYIQIYNDGYRPILGALKHPQALGISTQKTFSEIWHIIGPMFDGAMQGKAVWFQDFMLPLNRNGFAEECYFDFSYSPIKKEDGEIGGILVTVIETTQNRKVLVALKESELRFRAMADNIPNLAWMAHADGWIYWYNKKWYEFTGTTPQQMEGWGWQIVHDPKELPRVLEKWKESISTGQPFDMVFPLKNSEGKYKPFLTRVLPVYSEGEIVQWFGTNTEVTALIEAEQAIKESEDRFRNMAEDTDILIAISDTTSNVIYFNKAWTTLTGRKTEELLNFGWADLIHVDDKQNFVNLYLESFEKKEAWQSEFRVLDRFKNYRWLLAKGTLRTRNDGIFSGYISSSIDITDHKIAEKAVEELVRNLRNTIIQAPVAMCILRGSEFIVELANERMYELWGRPSEQVVNLPILEALPEVKGQGFDVLLNRVYQSGEMFSAQGVPATLTRNGKLETVYLNFVYEAYRENDGSISGIIAVAIDVTAQVQAHQKIEEIVEKRTRDLELANDKLQKSNAELAQFAYIASHDLQEPLRKISTFSQILKNNLGDDIDLNTRKYLDKINDSSSRMNKLIKDVLTYSELVKENEIFSPVNLNEILEPIIDDFELLIEQKNATIVIDKLPVIEAIPLQMSQLFSNLIGNALKFARNDINPVIKISAENKIYENRDMYKIIIADNGIGFKKEYADQIFNIFQRLHRKTEYEGTGIGLAMCKKIVLNHHGKISAEDSSENGAVFIILLPKSQF